ncbi:hypothetical protein BY996DRAFT_6413453 [Phakopsora pachyrhizi]|nr:hypothetical protein BY996DRAFT_6413453 [Phakopsora pachyrhizi]
MYTGSAEVTRVCVLHSPVASLVIYVYSVLGSSVVDGFITQARTKNLAYGSQTNSLAGCFGELSQVGVWALGTSESLSYCAAAAAAQRVTHKVLGVLCACSTPLCNSVASYMEVWVLH